MIINQKTKKRPEELNLMVGKFIKIKVTYLIHLLKIQQVFKWLLDLIEFSLEDFPYLELLEILKQKIQDMEEILNVLYQYRISKVFK